MPLRPVKTVTPLIAAFGLAATVAPPLALLAMGAMATPAHAARPRQPGDALRLFDKQRVWVVTNDDAALADELLEGCKPKERRVLSVGEWLQTPRDAQKGVCAVFLVNRERLPAWQKLPERCDARPTEVWTEAFLCKDRRSGPSWEVTISAPDETHLRRAVAEFRRLRDAPRQTVREDARSLAVIAVSPSAVRAGETWYAPNAPGMGHVLSLERLPDLANRLGHADEVLLIDRSATPSSASVPSLLMPDWVKAALDKGGIAPGDTVAWRETKTGPTDTDAAARRPRWRVVFSAPTAAALQAATARYPIYPDKIGDGDVVLASARDLRQVRRIAVASVKNEAGGELAKRLASRTAQEARALDAFEVLERTGLSEILGEVALGQAGLVEARDRAKVRRLAAADALLIVEVTQTTGRTEYAAAHERLTPKMDGPPRRPAEPSRLKNAIVLPGQEDNRVVRGVLDAVLSKVVGTRSDDEYRDLMDAYNSQTLPAWQRSYDFYQRQRERRAIEWRRTVTAARTATVSGSLRLVDLADGLVLWEAPFTGTADDEAPVRSVAVTSFGEDSSPDGGDVPESEETAPADLITRAAENALARGVATLRVTALLPSAVAVPAIAIAPPAPAAPDVTAATDTLIADPKPAPPVVPASGRVLDVDGDGVLVGLGATDGVRVGDILTITLASKPARKAATAARRSLPSGLGRQAAALRPVVVRVRVSRVRPRTCDAVWLPGAGATLRGKIAPGDAVTPVQAAR